MQSSNQVLPVVSIVLTAMLYLSLVLNGFKHYLRKNPKPQPPEKIDETSFKPMTAEDFEREGWAERAPGLWVRSFHKRIQQST